jgi:hypothetical protein
MRPPVLVTKIAPRALNFIRVWARMGIPEPARFVLGFFPVLLRLDGPRGWDRADALARDGAHFFAGVKARFLPRHASR